MIDRHSQIWESSTSESGAAKRKEPNTPNLGSGGASASVQKQVKI